MRKALSFTVVAAGLAVAVATAMALPAEAASLLASIGAHGATTTTAVTPAINDGHRAATARKVHWGGVRDAYRVWRPVVVAGPGWWWHGHYWYHRAWGPYGWRYW